MRLLVCCKRRNNKTPLKFTISNVLSVSMNFSDKWILGLPRLIRRSSRYLTRKHVGGATSVRRRYVGVLTPGEMRIFIAEF